MTQPFTPTPDMLAILAEVESNPRSKFLKLPIHLGNPGAYAETLTGSETFLTSAEKKLVRSYREELETWLFYRAMRLMAETPGVESQLADAEKMLKTSTEATQTKNDEVFLRKAWQGCKVQRALRLDSAKSCIQSALHLVPSASAKVLSAVEAERAGRLDVARIILMNVLSSKGMSDVRAYAASNLGWLYWQVGDYAAAGNAYAWAATLDPTLVAANVFALVSSGVAGDRKQVDRFSHRVEEMNVLPSNKAGRALIQFCEQGVKNSLVDGTPSPEIGESAARYPELAQAFLAPYIPQH